MKVIDRQPTNPKPCCILCAMWVCDECGDWHRKGASLATPHMQNCRNCGGIKGFYVAVRHRKDHSDPMPVPRRIPRRLPAGAHEMGLARFYGRWDG